MTEVGWSKSLECLTSLVISVVLKPSAIKEEVKYLFTRVSTVSIFDIINTKTFGIFDVVALQVVLEVVGHHHDFIDMRDTGEIFPLRRIG
jgi:hypothetical protein